MQFRVIDGSIFIETEGQAGAAVRFAASMPALTRLAGPMRFPKARRPQAQVDQLKGMLPAYQRVLTSPAVGHPIASKTASGSR